MIRYATLRARPSPASFVSRSCHPQSASIAVRSFFFGGDGDNNSNGGGSSNGIINSSSNSKSLAPSKLGSGDSAPRYPHILALPVVSRPVFPLLPTSITLRDEATIAAVEKLSRDNGYLGVFLRKTNATGVTEGGVILDKPELITDPGDLYRVGTFCQVNRFTRFGDMNGGGDGGGIGGVGGDENEEHNTGGPVSLWLMGHRRIDLQSIDNMGPPIDATVKHWDRLDYYPTKSSQQGDNTTSDDTMRALSNEVLSVIREVAQMNALFRESLAYFPARIDANDPYKLADFCASVSKSATPEELQAVLEERDAEMRLSKALVLLSKEKEVAKLQQEISAKVEEKMTDAQRKYFLNEQLKSIKKELGMEQDDKEALLEKYRKQLAECSDIPDEIQETIDSEMEKLSTLEKNSSEFNVTRSYLDWLCGVPWGRMSDENFDLKKARKVLDRDHYGLDDVKDTILQFIAVGKLKGSVQGKILCLAGTLQMNCSRCTDLLMH
jgi:Lon-like ATP-dependent protease